MRIVVASDDAERRASIADPLVRSSVPMTLTSTWEGLVQQVATPGCSLALVDGEVRLTRPVTPAMITRDMHNIRQDCLCYFMTPCALPEPA